MCHRAHPQVGNGGSVPSENSETAHLRVFPPEGGGSWGICPPLLSIRIGGCPWVTNFRGLPTAPMCGLSGLSQSEKPTVRGWQVFPRCTLQCGDVTVEERWASADKYLLHCLSYFFSNAVPVCDWLLHSCSLSMSGAPLRDLSPPQLPVTNHLLWVGPSWVLPTNSLGPSSPALMAEPGPSRPATQTTARLLCGQALPYPD